MTTIAAKLENSKESRILAILLASCVIGIFAQISIPLPFTPVPLTGQTLGVLLVGAMLGKNGGAIAAFLYLIQGVLGLPVLAGGHSGLCHFFGPTGGYLLAYPLEAYLIGWCLERERALGALFIPWSVQLAIGSLWLSFFVGIERAFFLGFYPFISIEIAKTFLLIVSKKMVKS